MPASVCKCFGSFGAYSQIQCFPGPWFKYNRFRYQDCATDFPGMLSQTVEVPLLTLTIADEGLHSVSYRPVLPSGDLFGNLNGHHQRNRQF